MSAAELPAVGQVVRLDAAASAEYARGPFNLLLTEPPEVSTVDAAEGRTVSDARWLLLTGWELDGLGRKVRLRKAVPARRDGIAVVSTSVPRHGAPDRGSEHPPRRSRGG